MQGSRKLYKGRKILRNNGFRTRFGLKSNLFDAAFLVNFAAELD